MVSLTKVKGMGLSGSAPGAKPKIPLLATVVKSSDTEIEVLLNTPKGDIGSLVLTSRTDGQTVLVADNKDTVTIAVDSEEEFPTVIQHVISPSTGAISESEEVYVMDIPAAIAQKAVLVSKPVKEEDK